MITMQIIDDPLLVELLCNPEDAPASTRIATAREQLSGMLDGGELNALPKHTRLQIHGLALVLMELSGEVFALENVARLRAAHTRRPWWREILNRLRTQGR